MRKPATLVKSMLPAIYVLLIFVLMPSAALAQNQTDQDEGGCFLCDLTSCSVGSHVDLNWFSSNNLHGGRHYGGCVVGGCVHMAYGSIAAVVDEAKAALALGTDDALASLLDENPSVRLRVDRSAIQVFTLTGEVALHAAIAPDQARRLATLLARRELAMR